MCSDGRARGQGRYRLEAVRAVGHPDPDCVDELARRNRRGVTNDSDNVPVPARLYPKDGKSVLFVVVRDSLDRTNDRLACVYVRPFTGPARHRLAFPRLLPPSFCGKAFGPGTSPTIERRNRSGQPRRTHLPLRFSFPADDLDDPQRLLEVRSRHHRKAHTEAIVILTIELD